MREEAERVNVKGVPRESGNSIKTRLPHAAYARAKSLKVLILIKVEPGDEELLIKNAQQTTRNQV